jgi:flavin-dependent dehydrogenase
VAVIGGGPAGTATALALRRLGLSVVVIEKSAYGNLRVGETLPPAIRPLLAELGVWERFANDGHLSSFGIRSAWGTSDLHINDFIANPYGAGWHVDRARFDEMLASCAEEAGAMVCRETVVTSCTRDDRQWRIDTAHHHFTADFIVDATGRSSSFARAQGVKRITCDRLIGVLAFGTSSNESANSFTLIESAENGWWYSAILPGSRTVIAFMTDSDLYDEDVWLRELQRTVHVQKEYEPGAAPRVVAANSARLQDVAGDGWLAAGDAAMSFDPLSGQGVYMALQWALHAARAIQQNALADYDRLIKEEFDRFLQIRASFYGKETRWPDSPFWQRRHALGLPFAMQNGRSDFAAHENSRDRSLRRRH